MTGFPTTCRTLAIIGPEAVWYHHSVPRSPPDPPRGMKEAPELTQRLGPRFLWSPKAHKTSKGWLTLSVHII